MMGPRRNYQKKLNPAPPDDISKTDLVLWEGWTYKTNRDVVREAATKGFVPLAIQFLGLRDNEEIGKVTEYVHKEVFVWVHELLKGQMIFRVLSVLTHTGLDPLTELENIFCKTTNTDIRNYIGTHLKTKKALSTHHDYMWQFLNVIMQNRVLIHQDGLSQESIEELESKSGAWTDCVATKLFISTRDSRLVPLIKGEILWNQLLNNNEISWLIAWIHLTYSPPTYLTNIPEAVEFVFKCHPINEEMIRVLSDPNLPKKSYELVVNELAKFGVFIQAETNNLLKILSRVNSCDNLVNIYQIFQQKYSNLTLADFTRLFVRFCVENNLLTVISSCLKNLDFGTLTRMMSESPQLHLLMDFQELVQDFSLNNLKHNIINVSKYLSKGDLEQFFCENPMIFLTLLTLEEVQIEQSLERKSLVLYGVDYYNCLHKIIIELPSIASFYNRKIKGVKCKLFYLDLIQKHFHSDVKQAYSFIFDNTPLPTFKRPELATKTYSKKLSYTFYVKQSRPILASKKYFLDQLEHNNQIDDEAKLLAEKKIYRIALKNFRNTAVIASCITFLELIEANLEAMQIKLNAAKFLAKSGMEADDVIDLFLDSDTNPEVIQKLLDENIVKHIEFDGLKFSGESFVQTVQLYDIVMKFTILNNLPLPERFLKCLAEQDLWFPFILYAQLKNYPAKQIKELVPYFKNPNLIEHMVHSVMHDIHISRPRELFRERDSRQHFLSRLGMHRSPETSGNGSIRSRSTVSVDSDSNLDTSEIDSSNTKTTLLQVIIRCHNSTDPPRSLLQASQLYKYPLLSIFATGYEPGSFLINWLVWLAVSTDLIEPLSGSDPYSVSPEKISNMLIKCVENRFLRTVFESCVIFVPDHPFTPFCDFLDKILKKDYTNSYKKYRLEHFHILKTQRRDSIVIPRDYELNYLKDINWIEDVALKLLKSFLISNTDSYHERIEVLELLCEFQIGEYFFCDLPNFSLILSILKASFDTELASHVDLEALLRDSNDPALVQNCLNHMVDLGMFTEAFEIATSANLPTALVVLKKWQSIFENKTQDIQRFLLKCNEDFELSQIPPELVTSFFKERACVNDLVRYYLLKYSHMWATKHNLPKKHDLERKKILAYAKISQQDLNISDLSDPDLNARCITYKQMLAYIQYIDNSQFSMEYEQLEELEILVNLALDTGDFILALKLERMFHLKNQDLEVLKLCYELAEGLVQLHQLNEEQMAFIKTKRNEKPIGKGNLNIFPNSNMFDSSQDRCNQATLNLIQMLVERVNHGYKLACEVFMTYRISVNTEILYETIVLHNTEPLGMLKEALNNDCANKLEVVHDFFQVYKWSEEMITDFLCNEFINAASSYAKSKIEIFNMWDIKIPEQFHLVLRLLKDQCSTLGYKFYKCATAIHEQQVTADLNFKISEMALLVELLIAAHSCFTTDCNMEGISIILKKSQDVIDHLLFVKSWKLIVRLLIGIGRYSELKFVFALLKEHDQFEFLLSKASKRDERLKVACIEYLKNYCPLEIKLYELVAIHFNLYSEIASLWEREAKQIVKNLVEITEIELNIKNSSEEMLTLTRSEGTHNLLNHALDKFKMAAKFHEKGGKLTKALHAVGQCELLCLQKSLFNFMDIKKPVPCLLSLSPGKIQNQMSTILNFHQSNILANAYDVSPNWAQILYQQAIVKEEITYFYQYIDLKGLDDELICNIAKIFKDNQNTATVEQFKTIRLVVEHIQSLPLKYRVAGELGIKSLSSDILNSEDVFYLKDTMYKCGFYGM
ncbi:hypothetical protein ABEB36_002284 [Hypothenemus hampei]|uniref:Spatacsin C-terminal domain-containing protein n=1 Tax=Hypothenemus hampei TaxID=57062 RepID=A0ABD1F8V4_HYPHA